MKIKEIVQTRWCRKSATNTKIKKPFEKYQVGLIVKHEDNGNIVTIEISGPKQNFTLVSCYNTLKICKPDQPVKELKLFFVTSEKNRGFAHRDIICTKIQGASHFALDGDTLIPYKSSRGGRTVEPV